MDGSNVFLILSGLSFPSFCPFITLLLTSEIISWHLLKPHELIHYIWVVFKTGKMTNLLFIKKNRTFSFLVAFKSFFPSWSLISVYEGIFSECRWKPEVSKRKINSQPWKAKSKKVLAGKIRADLGGEHRFPCFSNHTGKPEGRGTVL